MSKNIYTWFACCLLALLTALPMSVNAQETITLSSNVSQALTPGTTYTFYDSGGADGNYSSYENFTAVLTNVGDITINFSSLATESSSNCSNYDYMLIYDGDASTGTLLGRGQSGCTTNALVIGQNYVATSGTMTIVWKSDSGSNAAGWVATITAGAAPTCPRPTGLTITDITATSAKANWAAGGSESAWDISIDGGASRTSLSTTSRTFTGLTPNTEYTVSLRAKCGDDDYSAEVTATFRTECNAITSFPWSENFDAYEAGDFAASCWVNEHVAGSANYIFKIYGSAVSGNSTKMLQYPDMADGNFAKLTLPSMDIPAANAYEFYISVYRNTSYDTKLDEGVFVLAGTDTLAFIPRVVSSEAGVNANYLNNVPAESAAGWYEYNFTIPNAGVQNIAVLGRSKYGAATYIDNLMVKQLPSCIKPSAISVKDITTTSATLSWGEETTGDYLLSVKKDSIYLVGSAQNGAEVSGESYLLSNLEPATSYSLTVTLVKVCSATESSDSITKVVSFSTQCEAIAELPYVESFENSESSSLPSVCWTRVQSYSTYPSVSSSTYYSYQGSKYLYFSGGASTSEQIIALPEISADLSNARIRFWYKNSGVSESSPSLILGKMSDVDDANSFVAIATLDKKSSYTAYEKELTTVGSDYHYLAFKYAGGTSTSYAYVDSIIIDAIPSCYPVVSLGISEEDGAITANSVLIEWAGHEGQSSRYSITVKEGDSILSYNGELYENKIVSGNSLRVRGLQSTHSYTLSISIAAVCSENDRSEVFTQNISFNTLCEAISTLPWTEGFEDFSTGSSSSSAPICWDLAMANDGTYPYIFVNNSTGYVHSGSKSLYFQSSSSRSGFVILPEFASGVLEGAEINFWYKHESETSSGIPTVGYMTDIADTTTFVAIEVLTRSTAWSEATVAIPTLPASARLAIRYAKQSSNYYMGIDDITIREIPSCLSVSNLRVVDSLATTSSVSFAWSPNGDETSWRVVVKDGETELANAVVTDTVYAVTGLESSRSYTFAVDVYAKCGELESYPVSRDLSFATTCAVISTFPFSENFDGITLESEYTPSRQTLPACWSAINTTTYSSYRVYPTIYYYSFTDYSNSSPNSLRFYSYYYSWTDYDPQDQYAILPQMSGISGLRIKLSARAYSTSYDATFTVGVMTDPSDASTFVAIASKTPISTEYEDYVIPLNGYTGNGEYIAIKMAAANSINSTRGVFIDDIIVEELPSCLEPSGLNIIDITVDGATASWDRIANGAWKYAVALASEDVPAADAFIAVTDTFVVVTGKQDNTDYVFYLRQDCGGNDISEFISKPFRTIQLPSNPDNYVADFEAANDWVFINGELENAWVWGEAAHNGEGTHALYISNDGGTSHAYTNNSAVVVYATKSFTFAEGSYTFEYDWLANGESTYDYLRVALVPASVTLSAATSLPAGLSTSAVPEGWIALDGGSKLNLQTAWQKFTSEEIPVAAGTYNVVLMWRDDTSTGDQTPAAVDNFSISRVLCSKLSQVVVADSTITSSSAVISWAVIDGQNAWQIALDTVSAFNPSEASLIAATSNPYTLNGLAADKRYYAYVRANCGADGFSAWSDKVSFKTAKACQTPDGVTAVVTDSSAVISWNIYGQTAFSLRYGQGSNWLDTISVNSGSYVLTDLDANTSYNVQVQAACETTTWSTSYSFKTACAYVAAPWSEDFGSMTTSTIPDCWDNSASTTSTLTGTNPHYVWGVYSDNGNKVLRMYNYYVSSGTALINTPNISLPASPTCELKFDYAHNATCGDLIVKISEDNGANWITLQSFTKSGSTDRDHAGTMTEVAISLADYAGKAVMLQFYTEANYGSGAIFVDNIAVNLKFCGDIANIHQTAATTNSASLAWDAVEAAIGYEYSVVAKDAEVDEANAVSVSSAEATISGLAHSSFYTVYVRSICSEGAGDWSSAIFNTECAVISSQEGYDNEENALIFDFEEYAAGKNLKDEILCWDVISGVWKTTSTHRSGSVGAYVAGLGAADTAAVLVTPAFEIIDGQELVAFVKEGSSHNDGDSVLFYINDAPSLEGATLIGKIEAADDWREFRKKLPEGWFTEEEVDEYDEAYILIQAYAYSAIYFDDIMLHEAPSCSKIMNIALEAETNALNVTWQAGADETMWAVSYSVTNAGNAWEGLVSDTPAIVINNLPANTADSLFITIQSLCDGGATPGEVVEAAFAFKTLCGSISEFPWTENFNDLISSMPDCWDNSEGTATYEWEVTSSGHSGKGLTFDSYYNSSAQYSILATPVINLPEQEAELVFWHRNYAGGAYSVAIAVDGGERQNLATLSGSSWTEKVIDLAAYAGSQVQFFFSGTSNYSSTSDAALYLDDVSVRLKPTCFAPTALEAVLTQGNGSVATLNWSAGKDETAWVVEYATSEDFGDALQVNASDSTVALVDLTPETTYYARVKAVCGEEDESIWSDAISFFPTNAYSVTIANGTTTNGNVPVYGMWVDHLMHSQFIIPADSLESIQYGTLTQLTFYASTANVDWAAARFEVYMAETSATSISALEDWSSLTKVMNAGALSIVDGKMVVILDTPFNYHNANLLVGFNQTVEGTYKTSTWLGVQLSEVSVSNYDNGSVTQHSFLPKMTIGYLPGEPPACHQPSSVSVAALTATSASFVWESNADTCSVKLYNGTNLAADTLVAMAAMPFVINDLEPNTAYSFRFIVKGLCGEDGESEEKTSTVAVHTLCAAEVIDDENWWAEDFNSLTQQYSIPDCWSNEEGTTTSSLYKWGAVGTGAVGSAYLRFNSYNNADGNTNVLATPMLTLPETPAQLVFLCKNPAGGDFNVAIAGEDDVRDTVLSNLTGIADWTEQKIMLGDYAGQTIRIFFNATSNFGTSAGNCFIDLDSVVINAAPTCMPVKNIEKFSVSENEVVFIWESNSNETQWDVLVTDNLHENAELFNASVDVRAISIALEANTKYSMHVSVVAHCSDEDMAEAVSADFIFRSPLSEDMVRVVENNTVDTIDLSDPDEQAKWTLLGADETNHFIFACFNENAGLYISNDDASWQYTTIDAPSAAIAYRAFSVPEDNTPVEISFKWQANGQSTIDYGRAFIAGAEAEFEIANHQAKINGVQMAANNAILGAYNLSTGASVVLSGVSTEQSLADDDYVLDAGQYYIVFAWRNNDEDGAQNPLGIYDLKIWNKKGYIPSAVDTITGEGVEVQKILHNGQVYILRDGVIYSILGTIVR